MKNKCGIAGRECPVQGFIGVKSEGKRISVPMIDVKLLLGGERYLECIKCKLTEPKQNK